MPKRTLYKVMYVFTWKQWLLGERGLFHVRSLSTLLIFIISYDFRIYLQQSRNLDILFKPRNEVYPRVVCYYAEAYRNVLRESYEISGVLMPNAYLLNVSHKHHYSGTAYAALQRCCVRSEPKHPRHLWMGSSTYCRILGVLVQCPMKACYSESSRLLVQRMINH